MLQKQTVRRPRDRTTMENLSREKAFGLLGTRMQRNSTVTLQKYVGFGQRKSLLSKKRYNFTAVPFEETPQRKNRKVGVRRNLPSFGKQKITCKSGWWPLSRGRLLNHLR